jgi:hypothetical protein
LIAGGLDQSAHAAEGSIQNLRVQQLYASLQGSVCSNNWNQALHTIGPLMGSPDITPEYRQELARFRYQLESWRAAKSSVPNISGCNTASSDSPLEVTFAQDGVRMANAVRSLEPSIGVQQLYASMQAAVCQNDWNRALRSLNALVGSPQISPDYRQQLVNFRHQLEEWRASRSRVEDISTCRSVAVVPVPEEAGRLVDWAG